MRKYIVFLLVIATLILPTVALTKVNVVATLPDYGALIRAIGGEHVNLRVLAQPSEDPHYVDPKPSFIVALHRTDLLVSNGLELEIGWLPNLVVQSRNAMLQPGQLGRLEMGRHVPDLLEVPTGAIDRSMGDVHGQGNPHINHDPRRMRALLPLIAKRLTALDPANQAYYETRLASTLKSFDALLAELRTGFSQIPSSSRQVITYHRSLSYLLETLGLSAIATIEPKPGIPPNPSHVASVLGRMKRTGVGTVIQEVYYPSRTGKTLAKLGGGRLIVISGGTVSDESYVDNVRRNANQILASLRKD
jgi:zinc/manganese transport system substrate-binding protein